MRPPTHAGTPTNMKDSSLVDVVTRSFYNLCLPNDILSPRLLFSILVMLDVVRKAA